MTSEEAARILYNQCQGFLEDNIDYAGVSDAYKMAIEALEQDCISRTDMLDAIGHGTTYTSEDLQRIVEDLPSANRECGVEMSGIPTGSESEQNDDIEALLEHLWNATESESDKSADTFEKLLDSGFYERFSKGDEDADCD